MNNMNNNNAGFGGGGGGGGGGESVLPENYEGTYGGNKTSGCTRYINDALAGRFKCACGEMQFLHDFMERSEEDKARLPRRRL